MKKTLLLFTINFPYDKSEAFLESELPHLAQNFEQVIVVPMKGREISRAVPENVCVCAPLFSDRISQLLFFLKQYTKIRTWRLILAEWLQAIIEHKRFHVAVFYRVFNWASYRSALETHDAVIKAMDRPEQTIAYSYWAHTCSFAIPIMSRAGVPCAVRYHSVDLYLHSEQDHSYLYRKARYFPWREEVARSAAANIFISEDGLNYFEQMWPNLLGRTGHLSRLGVRDHGSCPAAVSDIKRLTIVSCSGVWPRKRVHLIAALTKELAKYRPVCWHHFGSGDMRQVESELRDASSSLETVMHGWLPNRDVLEFYASNPIDIFVNLSTREGVPVSIMEAMSFGVPVVATDVDGTSEAVITGKSGLLVHVDEPISSSVFARQILAALRPGGDLERAKPRQVYFERFNSEVNFLSLTKMLAELRPAEVER